MTVDHDISVKIKNMGFACACLVVSIHVGLTGDKFTLPWIFKEFIAEGIARIAVPFFFCVAGYFVARKYTDSPNKVMTWRVEIQKRIKTLAVPYWIWNLLYAPLLIGLAIVSDIAAGRVIRHIDWLSVVLRCSGLDLVNSPLLYPLWFIRNLLVLILVSPAILAVAEKFPKFMIVFVYVAHIVFELFGIELPSIISLQGLVYFMSGLVLGAGGIRVAPWLRSRLMGFVLLAIGVAELLLSKILELPSSSLTIIIPFLLAGMWCLMSVSRWDHRLVSLAFPIYLMHPFVLLALQYLWHLTAHLPTALVFLFRWIMAIFISCIFAWLLKKQCPNFARVAFGGRL